MATIEGKRPRGSFSPIVLGNALAGRVAVLPGGHPFSRIVRELVPMMGVVGGSVLPVGGALFEILLPATSH